MSAPCPEAPLNMPTMVSRLPKFGLRTKSVTSASTLRTGPAALPDMSSTRLTNGFSHHPGPTGVNSTLTAPSTSVKQNGFLRVPISFSVKWRKDNEGDGDKDLKRGRKLEQNRSTYIHQQHSVTSQCDAKKITTTSAGKGCSFGYPVTSSASTQSSPKTHSITKSSSKLGQTAPTLTDGSKKALNGLSGPKPWCRTDSFLRRPQSFTAPGGSRPSFGPGSQSGSTLKKKPQASRSHSSDNLGSAPSVQLSEGDRFRSRSLIQVRQQASPTPSSPSTSCNTTRSCSTNRVRTEGGLKELPLPSTQVSPGGNLTGGSRITDRGGKVRPIPSIPSLLPPSALKKPLLPSHGLSFKHSGISYKLSRPTLSKQPRPLRTPPAIVSKGDKEVGQEPATETPSMRGNSQSENPPETPGTERPIGERAAQDEVSTVVETLEDMSLSSNSSLDTDDISQEYMDDFDNLGNGGVGILLLSSKNDEDDSGLDQSCARFDDQKASLTAGLCFLDDGEQQEHHLPRLPHRRRSSEPDYHDQGSSSLDLSPSDSCGSGGTYMWDEEGLEPLGGAAMTPCSNTTHHIGSFDSDVNSIDLLNNLDSCDLDDDDLMLDVDVSQESSLRSDGDGISHMAEWRRRQLCWGTQDIHNDSDSDLQSFDLTEDPPNKKIDETMDKGPVLDLGHRRPDFPSPGVFGVDVEGLAEDCCAVRSQLEHLERLLLQEDVDNVISEDSSHSSDSQVQALLREVQQLREELRSRDQTIAHLTLQLAAPAATARCRCKETTGKMDRHTQTSVTSQTPWRHNAPQILQLSSQEPLTQQSSAPLPPPAKLRPTQLKASDCAYPTHRHTPGVKTKEKRGSSSRSMQPPSQLRLFLSQSSASAVTTVSKVKATRQNPSNPERNCCSGGLSRLPKPKK